MKATYIKTTLPSIINVSKIVTIHYYEFDKNFKYGPESHDFWELVYVDKESIILYFVSSLSKDFICPLNCSI